MMLSRLSIAALTVFSSSLVAAQTCSNTDSGACDFEPFNPLACGTDFACGYSNGCLAQENGYDPEADCCQAPQPSACTTAVDPQLCGTKQCPYANLCLATLAGYTQDQCESPPPECPTSSVDCSGEPSNPQKCGPAKECSYENQCEARGAGYTDSECCQDVRNVAACPSVFAPVSCGPPGGKQCPYSTQCEANGAGYNEKQCCPAVPEGTISTGNVAPVECGAIPCLYTNQAEATAAGFTEGNCCPTAEGACTADNNPVRCNDQCNYPSQSCADLAGFSSSQCCKQPQELGSCPKNIAPIACSQANCIYDNDCIAELAGFDPASCVQMGPSQLSDENPDSATSSPVTMALLGAFALLLV